MKRIKIKKIQRYMETGQRDMAWFNELLDNSDSIDGDYLFITDSSYLDIALKTGDERSLKNVKRNPSRRKISIGKSRRNLSDPGDALAWLIERVTGLKTGGSCSCESIRKEMNQKGWWWCIKNTFPIWKRVSDSAASRGRQLRMKDLVKWMARTSLNVGKINGN